MILLACLTIFVNSDGAISGLAFDWIVDNVYFTTNKGYILACGAGAVVTCFVILDGTFNSAGLCLTPNKGYFHIFAFSKVHRFYFKPQSILKGYILDGVPQFNIQSRDGWLQSHRTCHWFRKPSRTDARLCYGKTVLGGI